MATRLRVATSGKLADANDIGGAGAVGQFLRRIAGANPADPHTVDWAAAGGASTPLSGVLFVDKNTTTPLADQNGAIATPFATLTAAIVAASPVGILLIVPEDYSAEGAHVLPDKFISFVSWCSQDVGQPINGTGMVPVQMGSLTVFNDQNLYLYGVWVAGDLTMNTDGTTAAAERCIVGQVLGTGFLAGRECQMTGDFNGTGLVLQDSDISSNNTNINNGAFYRAEWRNCTFHAGPPAVAFSAPGGIAQIDQVTNSTWSPNVILTNGTLRVIGTPGTEIVNVVVPAVLDGQVGYLDVVMAGELTALPANTGIVATPTADLVAAGAGGGYINSRVSAPGTVRMAFIGPLAGGAVDFHFFALNYF